MIRIYQNLLFLLNLIFKAHIGLICELYGKEEKTSIDVILQKSKALQDKIPPSSHDKHGNDINYR